MAREIRSAGGPGRVTRFAEWLAATPVSLAIQTHEWVIPTIQSIHIIAIAVVMGSVLMIDMRIVGWAWRDQTLAETAGRFLPWLSAALVVLLISGVVMIAGEPVRQLLALSFWLKMGVVLVGTAVTVVFRRSLRRHAVDWESSLGRGPAVRALAILTLFIWACAIVLGRLIAYDYVWGEWSRALKG
jgi:hypothetical protein